jgi:Integrase zinc binding domain
MRKEHLRGNKLADKITANFYWYWVKKDCKQYTKACEEGQANKIDHTKL